MRPNGCWTDCSRDYPRLPVCLQGDALYAAEPVMEDLPWLWLEVYPDPEGKHARKSLAESYAWIARWRRSARP